MYATEYAALMLVAPLLGLHPSTHRCGFVRMEEVKTFQWTCISQSQCRDEDKLRLLVHNS